MSVKQRKHRVVVEITFDEPRAEKAATHFVYDALHLAMDDKLDEVSRVECKQFGRVLTSYKAKASPSVRRIHARLKNIRTELDHIGREPVLGA
jgi:hypothetical protein